MKTIPDNLYIDTSCIDAMSAGDEIPETLICPLCGEPELAVEYVRTDAWRGYYNPKPIDGIGCGLVEVAGGWMTGDWDDAPIENRGSVVEGTAAKLAEKAPTVFILTPSSNAFSTIWTALQAGSKPKPGTYNIIRRFYAEPSVLIKTGLTLEEAQAHCDREDTKGDGWFDTFEEVPA